MVNLLECRSSAGGNAGRVCLHDGVQSISTFEVGTAGDVCVMFCGLRIRHRAGGREIRACFLKFILLEA